MNNLIKLTLLGLSATLIASVGANSQSRVLRNSPQAQNTEAGSWGGKVRSGPGREYRSVGSLNNGDPIQLLENTGRMFNGYPWFRISFANGQTGFQWGGIICGYNAPINGTYNVCDRDNRRRALTKPTKQRTSPRTQNVEAGSWGGKVRAGPGTEYRQVGSLSSGDPIQLIEKTRRMMNGYPWFRISFANGQTGYQWGGIICGYNAPISGAARVCDRDNRRRVSTKPTKQPNTPQIRGVEATSWGGVVRSGPGTEYRKVGSLKTGESIKLIENTGRMMNGYPWFRINFANGKNGFQWGGIICAKNTPISGTHQVCGQDNRQKVSTKPTKKISANGTNVSEVYFDNGSFIQEGNKRWSELGNDGKSRFSFFERTRDEWSVYLRDNSRGVNIQLDLHRKKVVYSDDKGQKFDLYNINDAFTGQH